MSGIDPNGRVPLHYAAMANGVREVEARLAAGDGLNHADRQGFTP
jgi:ankyrin repeat protein